MKSKITVAVLAMLFFNKAQSQEKYRVGIGVINYAATAKANTYKQFYSDAYGVQVSLQKKLASNNYFLIQLARLHSSKNIYTINKLTVGFESSSNGKLNRFFVRTGLALNSYGIYLLEDTRFSISPLLGLGYNQKIGKRVAIKFFNAFEFQAFSKIGVPFRNTSLELNYSW